MDGREPAKEGRGGQTNRTKRLEIEGEPRGSGEMTKTNQLTKVMKGGEMTDGMRMVERK
jgi:hypothetical protein